MPKYGTKPKAPATIPPAPSKDVTIHPILPDNANILLDGRVLAFVREPYLVWTMDNHLPNGPNGERFVVKQHSISACTGMMPCSEQCLKFYGVSTKERADELCEELNKACIEVGQRLAKKWASAPK